MNTLKSPQLDEIAGMVSEAVGVVFDTMLKTRIAPVDDLLAEAETMVVGSIGFVGDVNGLVYVRLSSVFARTLASRMLARAEEALDDEMVNDVVAEVSNMIVGSVKSQLCDAGFPCALGIPSVVRGDSFSVARTRASESALLGFEAEDEPVFVELLLKQT